MTGKLYFRRKATCKGKVAKAQITLNFGEKRFKRGRLENLLIVS